VYFKNGEAEVPDYALERLSRLSMFLKDHQKLSVTLTGYTDQVGPAEANLSLAQQRVDGVREQLIAGGVDASRIQLNALGESTPTVKAGDVANYVLDRRVSIVLDRKSTRLNSSHLGISYAVFCSKKKKHTLRATEQ